MYVHEKPTGAKHKILYAHILKRKENLKRHILKEN